MITAVNCPSHAGETRPNAVLVARPIVRCPQPRCSVCFCTRMLRHNGLTFFSGMDFEMLGMHPSVGPVFRGPPRRLTGIVNRANRQCFFCDVFFYIFFQKPTGPRRLGQFLLTDFSISGSETKRTLRVSLVGGEAAESCLPLTG